MCVCVCVCENQTEVTHSVCLCLKQIRNEVGACRPLYNVYDQAVTTVCTYMMDVLVSSGVLFVSFSHTRDFLIIHRARPRLPPFNLELVRARARVKRQTLNLHVNTEEAEPLINFYN